MNDEYIPSEEFLTVIRQFKRIDKEFEEAEKLIKEVDYQQMSKQEMRCLRNYTPGGEAIKLINLMTRKMAESRRIPLEYIDEYFER